MSIYHGTAVIDDEVWGRFVSSISAEHARVGALVEVIEELMAHYDLTAQDLQTDHPDLRGLMNRVRCGDQSAITEFDDFITAQGIEEDYNIRAYV